MAKKKIEKVSFTSFRTKNKHDNCSWFMFAT